MPQQCNLNLSGDAIKITSKPIYLHSCLLIGDQSIYRNSATGERQDMINNGRWSNIGCHVKHAHKVMGSTER